MTDAFLLLGPIIVLLLVALGIVVRQWQDVRSERDLAKGEAANARERADQLQRAYGPVELADQRVKMAELAAQKAEHDHAMALRRQQEQINSIAQRAEQEQRSAAASARSEVSEMKAEKERLSKECEALQRELAKLDALDVVGSVGLYRPHYEFETSERFAEKLEAVREQMKETVKAGGAVLSHVAWTVDGSKRAGAKMTKEFIKLVLRAFNGECDASVAKVKWDSIVQMEKRIVAAFEAINKIAESNRCEITKSYLDLRLAELRLAHEMQVKKQAEREEQRAIREQMREEERAQREIERAKDEAEKEELRRARALEQARKEADRAVGEAKAEFDAKVKELEAKLAEAQSRVRAVSMAELTTTGHVYVLSNIGSFGDGVYKIGMTRRLEPQDRVDELGDASVPFPFDVHAMIRTVNAPALEKALHERFASKRVNLVNLRKEFFRVTLEEIEAVVKEMSANPSNGISAQIEWRRTGMAEEYWESKTKAGF